MEIPTYIRLNYEEVRQLVAPGNEEVREVWEDARDTLFQIVGSYSDSYPRPLYEYREDEALAELESLVEALQGTPFHEKTHRNRDTARLILAMRKEQGRTEFMRYVVEEFLNDLHDDAMTVQYYPEIVRPARVPHPARLHPEWYPTPAAR